MLTATTLASLPRTSKRPAIGSNNLALDDLGLEVGDILCLIGEDDAPKFCPVAWFSRGLIWAFFDATPVCFPVENSCKELGIVEILRPAVDGEAAMVEPLVEDI